jgi:hypothetical protein
LFDFALKKKRDSSFSSQNNFDFKLCYFLAKDFNEKKRNLKTSIKLKLAGEQHCVIVFKFKKNFKKFKGKLPFWGCSQIRVVFQFDSRFTLIGSRCKQVDGFEEEKSFFVSAQVRTLIKKFHWIVCSVCFFFL